MPRFKQFIYETILTEKQGAELNADLIYQKIIDVLDNAHIDFGEDRIDFHVGRIIKNSGINLSMVIRRSNTDNVRMAKRSDEFVIVIDTQESMPSRSKVDTFLTKNKGIATQVKRNIATYLKRFYGDDEPKAKTKYEEETTANDDEYFESMYEALVKNVKERVEEFKEMSEDLHQQMDTEDHGVKETGKMALSQLQKEYFGDNSEEFKKIAFSLVSNNPDGKDTAFTKRLSPDNRKRLENRLDSLYDQKIKPMLV